MKEHGPESPSGMVLFDQLLVQPPRIFFTFVLVDVIRAALQSLPEAYERAKVWDAVAVSWAYWPAATYLLCVNRCREEFY